MFFKRPLLKGLVSHDAYFEVSLKVVKLINIVKVLSFRSLRLFPTCVPGPPSLNTCPHAGDGSFLFWQYLDAIWGPVRTQSNRFASELSYTRCREILLKQLSYQTLDWIPMVILGKALGVVLPCPHPTVAF